MRDEGTEVRWHLPLGALFPVLGFMLTLSFAVGGAWFEIGQDNAVINKITARIEEGNVRGRVTALENRMAKQEDGQAAVLAKLGDLHDAILHLGDKLDYSAGQGITLAPPPHP